MRTAVILFPTQAVAQVQEYVVFQQRDEKCPLAIKNVRNTRVKYIVSCA